MYLSFVMEKRLPHHAAPGQVPQIANQAVGSPNGGMTVLYAGYEQRESYFIQEGNIPIFEGDTVLSILCSRLETNRYG